MNVVIFGERIEVGQVQGEEIGGCHATDGRHGGDAGGRVLAF